MKPSVPPGIRLHLEQAERSMRESGITQEMIDWMLDEMVRAARVEALVVEVTIFAVMRLHEDDGWFARRRLRRALGEAPERVVAHLDGCGICRAAMETLRDLMTPGYL